VLLCERVFAYRGVMRALAEAEDEKGGAPGDLADLIEEEDLEDEVDPQNLDELGLTMEVRTDADSDGAGLAGQGSGADAPVAAQDRG
jgi:hypothetical protein